MTARRPFRERRRVPSRGGPTETASTASTTAGRGASRGRVPRRTGWCVLLHLATATSWGAGVCHAILRRGMRVPEGAPRPCSAPGHPAPNPGDWRVSPDARDTAWMWELDTAGMGSSTPPACVGVGHRCCWERRPAPDWPSVAADGHDTDPPPNDVRGIAARPAAARTGRSALAHAAPTGDASHATPRPRRPCSAWKTSQSTTGARRTQTAARTHTPQHQTYRTVPTITTTAQRILRSIERRPTTPVQLFRRRIVDGPRTATGSRRAQSTATDGPRTAPARPWERAGVPLSGDFGPFDRSGPPFGRCTRSGGRLGPP